MTIYSAGRIFSDHVRTPRSGPSLRWRAEPTGPARAASTGGTERAHAHAGVHTFVIPGTIPTSALWGSASAQEAAAGGRQPRRGS